MGRRTCGCGCRVCDGRTDCSLRVVGARGGHRHPALTTGRSLVIGPACDEHKDHDSSDGAKKNDESSCVCLIGHFVLWVGTSDTSDETERRSVPAAA